MHSKNEPTALDALLANISVPFERAFAMPKAVYTDKDFLRLEQEHLFKAEWICAGRAESLPNVGDYLTLTIAQEPIVVLRNTSGEIRALSNVCRHRMSVIMQGQGNARALVCPYHAWTYNLDGSLRGAPAMGLNCEFNKEKTSLPNLQCRVWQGWILVSLNPNAPDPDLHLAPVQELVGYLDMASYSQTFQKQFRWNTNWKVLAENFMESYHLPVCHAQTIGGSVDLMKMDCPEGLPAFNYHWIEKNDKVPLALAHPSNSTLKGLDRRRTWLLAIYPSLMITLTPGYFWYLSLTPDGPDHVQVLFGGGLSKDWAADPKAPAYLETVMELLDDVNIEDKGCVEKVYQGMLSGLSAPGPLSHLERPNYDFATYLARRITAGRAGMR